MNGKNRICKMFLLKLLDKIQEKVFLIWEYSLLFYYSRTCRFRRPKKETGKILIARTDGLGDYVMWMSAAKQIRTQYPDKKIVMMIDREKPILNLTKYNPDIDEIIEVFVKGNSRFSSINKIRNMEFDLVIQPVYSRAIFTDILIFAAKAGKRITLDTNGQLMRKREWKCSNKGYDEIIPCSYGVKHELIRYEELIHGMGKKDFKIEYPELMVSLFPEIKIQSARYILIFPAGSWQGKKWESFKFARLLDWMLHKIAVDIYLAGDEKDAIMCEDILIQMTSPERSRVYNVAGQYSIEEIVSLVSNAFMVIGNDTGALHMAVACRKPGVVITSDREIGRFFPYPDERAGDKKRSFICLDAGFTCRGCLARGHIVCPYLKNEEQTLPCIKAISVEKMKEAVETILNEMDKTYLS